MLHMNAQSQVIFFPRPVNFRCSFDSLSYLIESELGVELTPNLFVLFVNPRKNRIKILYHEDNQLLLLAARFEHALYFTFQDGVVLDQTSFHKFITTPNPRRRVNKIKGLKNASFL